MICVKLLWALLGLVVGSACAPSTSPATATATATAALSLPQAVKLNGQIFGSEWNVTIIARDGATLSQARAQSVVIAATLAEVGRQLSLWEPQSELSRFNRAAWTEAVAVSPGLSALISTCLDIGQKTEGAFDVTLGPVLDVWGFSASTKGKVSAPPSAAAIAAARARTGLSLLHVAGGGIQKDREDMVIDLTAVGDGAGAAAVMAALRERGFADVLVDVAGEVVVAGHGLKGPWQIGVNVPTADAAPDAVERVVSLQADSGLRALSTSGTYREGFSSEGQLYPHILDPQTGAPVTHNLLSCTVVADDVIVADALSTACVALGEKRSRAMLERFLGAEALFLSAQADHTIEASMTKGFPNPSR